MEKIYAIGEVGPAGGFVFYDKGTSSDGWRYLEATPKETEFPRTSWGPITITKASKKLTLDVNLGTAVGSGKQNTEILYSKLQEIFTEARKGYAQEGEEAKWETYLKTQFKYAIRICAELDFGGFKDWFLPSKDELELIYQNLVQKGIGGFGKNKYWSSSKDSTDKNWVYYHDFDKGNAGTSAWNNEWLVRAVRSF